WQSRGFFSRSDINNGAKEKMRKSLIASACLACALLSSSAFAQEKTAEQYREERSHIFGIDGLESQTYARVVASGAKLRLGPYVSLNPDCSATGDVTVRVTKQPEHGTVEIVAATDYVHYPKENIRSKCPSENILNPLNHL